MIVTSSGLSTTPYVPKPYMTLGSRFIVDHPRCMLVADPGLGKTGMSLMALELLTLLGSSFFPALIVAPKRVAEVVWTGERDKWSTFAGISMVKIMGSLEERMQALRTHADVYIINYDLVPWLVSMFPGSKWPFKIVFADESSRLKGFRIEKGTVRSAALADIAQFTGRWVNLTGTPMPNGMQDLWGQMYFIDFGERLKRNYTAYFEAFFIQDQYTKRIRPQYGAEPAIQEAVKDVLVAFRAEDWLDITQPQYLPVRFSLTPSARAQYRSMERDFWLEVDTKEIEAGTAMVKSTKLLQLAGGSIYDHDTAPHHIHDCRLEALDSVLEETGNEQVLVSYWWKTDPPRILKHLTKLGISARMYSGKRDEDDWNARKFRVLLLQEQSAFGLNLHEPCRDVFFYTYTWNAELWTQMINRVGPARQAQANKKCVVRVWYAMAEDTIESEVVESNFGKITVEEAFKRARAQRKNV